MSDHARDNGIRIDADEMVEFLNSLLAADSDAVNGLFSTRVSCNETLAFHPTVQVGSTETGYDVGILGILNGYFGGFTEGKLEGWGAIASVSEDETIIGFKRLHSEDTI